MTVAVVTAFVGAVTLSAVYGFFYLQERERFLGLWTAAWAFNAVRYGVELYSVARGQSAVTEAAGQTAQLLVAALLVVGVRILTDRARAAPPALMAAAAAGVAWAWGASLFEASFLVVSLPVRALAGAGFLWAGYMVLRSSTLRGVGKPVVGWSFVLWGIHKLDYPLLRPVEWFAPWGFGLSTVFEVVLAFGILVVYFDKVRSLSEARFSALFERNRSIMGLVEPETGVIVDVNPAACAFYGYPRERFVGMSVTALNGRPLEEWRRRVSGVLQETGPIYVSNRLADGEIREVETYYTLVDVGGKPLYHAIVHDVTERRRAERDLAASEERFRLLAENAQDFIFLYRLAEPRGFVFASPAVESVLGISPEQLYESPLSAWEIVDPGDRAAIESAVARGTAPPRSVRITRPDGTLGWVDVRMTVARDGAGVPVSVEGIVRDVTRERVREAELSRLLSAVEQMAEVVLVTDVDGAIVYVNPAFERVTGYPREAALGANPRLLKSGRQGAGFYRELWETILAGEVWSGRFTNLKRSGETYEEEATISPIRDADGVIVNFVAVKRDITRELALEEQLLQSQKLEAVGRLAGGIAHDFNNLLTTIGGYSDMLAGTLPSDDPRRQDLAEVRRAADRAGDLTRRLLAFSRRGVVRPEPVDVSRTIAGMASMLRRMLGERIELITELHPGPLVVLVDPGQVEQVVMNLVLNASDAMPDGGMAYVVVDPVSAPPEDAVARGLTDPGRYVRLTVRDTGLGMDDETRTHVFEPFFTTKPLDKGSGLGLATVYGIVEGAGGSVSVTSAPGMGSTFEVLLPLRDAAAFLPRQPSQAPGRTPVGVETVLVVEDEPGVRRLTARTLRALGYEVLEADGGEAALEILARDGDGVHLVVTDVVMPRVGGAQLAERLRLERPDLRVVFVSGYADGMTGSGAEAPPRWFLPKPFTADELARIVREALDS